MDLPYRIAVLCYLFDAEGKMLLLHRARTPNKGLLSPIGGKLEQGDGESPTACAAREIEEEAGIHVPIKDLRLTGIVSEQSFEGTGHWLLFCYEVTQPVVVEREELDEGRLEWHDPKTVMDLKIPETDRRIIWPLFQRHRGGGFFMVHIDCSNGGLSWEIEQSVGATKRGEILAS